MAAGLAAERVACLHPSKAGLIERALCRRWGIEAVICRRSGGITEELWHSLSAESGLPLLLLERPPEPAGLECHGMESLLDRLGTPEWG
jgi:precorrin-6A/cobalt-precorrin-6A reductase